MSFKKHYIFSRLFIKSETPLFNYLVLAFLFGFLFNFILNDKVNFIQPKEDVSFLLKVVEVPNRSKVGEIRFKALILGEVKNNTNQIEVEKVFNDIYLYCKAIELPWKNISNLNKGALMIARGEALKVNRETNFSNFLTLNNYSGVFKIKFVSIIENQKLSPYKAYFNKKIDQFFSSSEVKAIYNAMLFGDKSGLSVKLEKIFRTLGLSHLLVVSGFHVGLFFFISSVIFIKFFRCFSIVKNYVSLNLISDIFSLFLTFFYCLLVGLKASCVRALLSVFCFVIYKNLGYRATFYHLLSIYLFCFILLNQNLLLTLSVKYSFLALFGIMYATLLSVNNKVFDYILVSTFACTFTSILTLLVFDSYNFLSLITNLIFSPLLILLICKVGFFLLILSLISIELTKTLAIVVQELNLMAIEVLDYLSLISYFEMQAGGISRNIYFLSFFLIFIYINRFLIKRYRLKYNI